MDVQAVVALMAELKSSVPIRYEAMIVLSLTFQQVKVEQGRVVFLDEIYLVTYAIELLKLVKDALKNDMLVLSQPFERPISLCLAQNPEKV